MEKINYIIYCWSQYIYGNRIVGIYLIILAASILLMAFLTQKNNYLFHERITDSIKSEISDNRFIVWIFYCIIVTILLIIPFTAILLMKFQTVFYSYSTLWIIATSLPLLAFALTLYTVMLKQHVSKIKYSIFLVATFVVLLLCGNMGKSTDNVTGLSIERPYFSYQESLPLLEKLNDYAQSTEYNGELTILAPMNITAYSHMYSSNIKTLYGKDMWDTSMAPLTYNEYPEEYHKLYTWINCIESYGSFYSISEQFPVYTAELTTSYEEYETLIENDQALGGKTYFNMARDYGVDIIVVYTYTGFWDYEQFDYLVDELSLRQEYVSINDTDGYILLFLE